MKIRFRAALVLLLTLAIASEQLPAFAAGALPRLSPRACAAFDQQAIPGAIVLAIHSLTSAGWKSRQLRPSAVPTASGMAMTENDGRVPAWKLVEPKLTPREWHISRDLLIDLMSREAPARLIPRGSYIYARLLESQDLDGADDNEFFFIVMALSSLWAVASQSDAAREIIEEVMIDNPAHEDGFRVRFGNHGEAILNGAHAAWYPTANPRRPVMVIDGRYFEGLILTLGYLTNQYEALWDAGMRIPAGVFDDTLHALFGELAAERIFDEAGHDRLPRDLEDLQRIEGRIAEADFQLNQAYRVLSGPQKLYRPQATDLFENGGTPWTTLDALLDYLKRNNPTLYEAIAAPLRFGTYRNQLSISDFVKLVYRNVSWDGMAMSEGTLASSRAAWVREAMSTVLYEPPWLIEAVAQRIAATLPALITKLGLAYKGLPLLKRDVIYALGKDSKSEDTATSVWWEKGFDVTHASKHAMIGRVIRTRVARDERRSESESVLKVSFKGRLLDMGGWARIQEAVAAHLQVALLEVQALFPEEKGPRLLGAYLTDLVLACLEIAAIDEVEMMNGSPVHWIHIKNLKSIQSIAMLISGTKKEIAWTRPSVTLPEPSKPVVSENGEGDAMISAVMSKLIPSPEIESPLPAATFRTETASEPRVSESALYRVPYQTPWMYTGLKDRIVSELPAVLSTIVKKLGTFPTLSAEVTYAPSGPKRRAQTARDILTNHFDWARVNPDSPFGRAVTADLAAGQETVASKSILRLSFEGRYIQKAEFLWIRSRVRAFVVRQFPDLQEWLVNSGYSEDELNRYLVDVTLTCLGISAIHVRKETKDGRVLHRLYIKNPRSIRSIALLSPESDGPVENAAPRPRRAVATAAIPPAGAPLRVAGGTGKNLHPADEGTVRLRAWMMRHRGQRVRDRGRDLADKYGTSIATVFHNLREFKGEDKIRLGYRSKPFPILADRVYTTKSRVPPELSRKIHFWETLMGLDRLQATAEADPEGSVMTGFEPLAEIDRPIISPSELPAYLQRAKDHEAALEAEDADRWAKMAAAARVAPQQKGVVEPSSPESAGGATMSWDYATRPTDAVLEALIRKHRGKLINIADNLSTPEILFHDSTVGDWINSVPLLKELARQFRKERKVNHRFPKQPADERLLELVEECQAQLGVIAHLLSTKTKTVHESDVSVWINAVPAIRERAAELRKTRRLRRRPRVVPPKELLVDVMERNHGDIGRIAFELSKDGAPIQESVVSRWIERDPELAVHLEVLREHDPGKRPPTEELIALLRKYDGRAARMAAALRKKGLHVYQSEVAKWIKNDPALSSERDRVAASRPIRARHPVLASFLTALIAWPLWWTNAGLRPSAAIEALWAASLTLLALATLAEALYPTPSFSRTVRRAA